MTTGDRRDSRIGLKLWSRNVDLAARAAALVAEGWIHFIELYVVPDTIDSTLGVWCGLGVPFMLHCPHAAHKFNLAKAELFDANVVKFGEVQRFADALHASVIVMHGGNRGEVDETVRQLRHLNDQRICLENKPKVSLSGGLCIGHSPEQVADIVAAAELTGFVLDFGHATCAANSAGADPLDYVARFMALQPRIFHIGDGDRASEKDTHLNLGEGSFDIPRLLSFVPPEASVTIETPTDLTLGLADFVENVKRLRQAIEASMKVTS